MLRETLIETPRMSLWYLPDDRIIHHQMHQYPSQETLEEVLLRGLEAMKEHGATKWLSDDRAGGAVPRSHHEWGEQVWAPQAIAAGWKYWAFLPPEQTLGHANMTRLVQVYAAKGVLVKVFSEPTQAQHWLRRQGPPGRVEERPTPISVRPKRPTP